jgi:cation diffusion facilitator family transporter
VLWLTLLTMVVEIAVGWHSGSLALLADGWHMGTHALALGVTVLAYRLSRRHAHDARYAFGTWKIEVLGSFSSALVLAQVAIFIGFESVSRLMQPQLISVKEALWVAALGLAVNLLSAALLHVGADHAGAAHHHHHHDESAHSHQEPAHHLHQDLNLQAAYVHVLTDALTSVLAIVALVGAWLLGWWWLDALVGFVGAVVIAVWACKLLRQSAAVLLDREMDHPLTEQLRRAIESDADACVADLHLWRVGRNQFAAIICIVADAPLMAQEYRARLQKLPALQAVVHLSLEVNRCPQAAQS